MPKVRTLRSSFAVVGMLAITQAGATTPPSPVLGGATAVQMPGGIARTLVGRFSETIDVKDFGAAGDGVTDDTAAFNAAFAQARTALATQSVEILLPPGRYKLSSAWMPAITAAKPFAVAGAGPGMTTVIFTGTDGFDITAASTAAVMVTGMQLLRTSASPLFANTALSVVGSGTRVVASHLDIQDTSGTQTDGWATGVGLVATSNASVDDVRVEMPLAPSGTVAGVGVSIGGTTAMFATDNHVDDLVATGGWAGLSVPGFAQGVYVSKPVFVANTYGINWNGNQTGDAAELLVADGGEFNNVIAGIYLAHGSLSQIVSNHFFRFNPSTTGAWDAIDLETGNNYVVSGNNIYGAAKGTETGIMADNLGGTPNTITGNVIGSVAGYGISLSGTTVDTTVSGNSLNGTTNAVYDASNGSNLLGPVMWNGNPAPIRYDGVHFDVLTALWFPSGTNPSAIMLADGAGGLSVINPSGTAGLSTQGNATIGGNVYLGAGHSFVTRDGTGTLQGYLSATTAGGVQISTLQAGRNAQVQITPGNGAGMPACSASLEGTRTSATDATSATFGAVYGSGGTNHEPLYCNGSNWVIE